MAQHQERQEGEIKRINTPTALTSVFPSTSHLSSLWAEPTGKPQGREHIDAAHTGGSRQHVAGREQEWVWKDREKMSGMTGHLRVNCLWSAGKEPFRKGASVNSGPTRGASSGNHLGGRVAANEHQHVP